jgi:hypothetical protein
MEKKKIDKICEIIMTNLQKMSDRTWDNCFMDKNSADEVSKKDWEDSSFTFEELVENIRKDLENLTNHP